MFDDIYRGKKVLVTGHSGFKGSWLSMWLQELGAEVAGYSLPPATEPSHYKLLNLDMHSSFKDLRDFEALKRCMESFQPDAVFHLAAQPLVRESYTNPRETFEVNVQGTVNVLEACKQCDSVRAVVVVSSDKCYENREWHWGYRENEAMGGYDPYSASKGCTELVCSAYQRSFFNVEDFGTKHNCLVGSCRAGNVVGGGDWAADRLIPDVMRATAQNEHVMLRNPDAVRPWQHVLESLSGYLCLGKKLLEGKKKFSSAWNFGPSDDSAITVKELVKIIKDCWDKVNFEFCVTEAVHEATLLKLDCSKARMVLKWHGVWDCTKTIEHTVNWYKHYYSEGMISSQEDLKAYVADASAKGLKWTK